MLGIEIREWPELLGEKQKNLHTPNQQGLRKERKVRKPANYEAASGSAGLVK